MSEVQAQTLVEKLAKLKRLDVISVTWMDASQSNNVSINSKIPNHSVETKVISEGKFLGVQKGELYGDDHLVMLKQLTEDEHGTIQSIPVTLIRELNYYNKVQLMSKPYDRVKVVRIRYADGTMKTVTFREIKEA